MFGGNLVPFEPIIDSEDTEEREGGQDTDTTINPQTLLVLAAIVVMFLVLIVGWMFAGQILTSLDNGIEQIGKVILQGTEKVAEVGEVVAQEIIKSTSSVINQISGAAGSLAKELAPLLKLIEKTTFDLLKAMDEAFNSVVAELNSLGTTINSILSVMLRDLNIAITTAINATLGVIQTIFAPFFQ